MVVIEIESEDQFNSIIKNNERVIVDYYATFCGPCKAIAPKFLNLSNVNPMVTFVKVDIVKNASFCRNIKSLPTFKTYLNGHQINELIGADYTRLLNLISLRR